MASTAFVVNRLSFPVRLIWLHDGIPEPKNTRSERYHPAVREIAFFQDAPPAWRDRFATLHSELLHGEF